MPFDFLQLQNIMTPHEGAGDQVDWAVVRDTLGMDLPSDYKKFMKVYGAGGIDDCLQILAPCDLPGADFAGGTIASEAGNAHLAWELDGGDLRANRPGVKLIPWGVDSSADILCWLVNGREADAWITLVFNRGKARWTEYGVQMAEFLKMVFCAELDKCPLGEVKLWGNRSPRFLNWREEERIYNSGIDPWTGDSIEFF